MMGFASYNFSRQNLGHVKQNPQEFRYNMSGFPVAGNFVRWDDARRFANDYLNMYGMKWSDVKYPSMMYGSGNLGRGFGSAMYGTAFVSGNLMRMYKDGYGYRKHGYDPAYG